MAPVSAVICRALVKRYDGGVVAVDGLDLEVRAGECFGLLGPNGAGKTTTVEILEGYHDRNAGDVEVLGVDPAAADRGWRQRIGFVLQECRLTPELTVWEAIEQYAGYYDSPREVGGTIELVGLTEKANTRTARLSGGQQRRLDVALALIGDPELLFLDEPTTGFDPSARRQAWDVIRSLRDLGKTVFLTTHYMEEAQELADRAAIIAEGRIIAEGDPDQLGGRGSAQAMIRFRLPEGARVASLPAPFTEAAGSGRGEISLASADPVRDLRALLDWSAGNGGELPGLEVSRPSLEDVYLELTGREPEGERGEGA